MSTEVTTENGDSDPVPNCAICLQSLDSCLSTLSCGHVFHYGCIETSSQYCHQCPLCKQGYEKIIKLKLVSVEKVRFSQSIVKKTLEDFSNWRITMNVIVITS